MLTLLACTFVIGNNAIQTPQTAVTQEDGDVAIGGLPEITEQAKILMRRVQKKEQMQGADGKEKLWPFSVMGDVLSSPPAQQLEADTKAELKRIQALILKPNDFFAQRTEMELRIGELEKEVERHDPMERSCEAYAKGNSTQAQQIHFFLTTGYSVNDGQKLNISSLPATYQCAIESALATKGNVTLWYHGQHDIIDDVFPKIGLKVERHRFNPDTATGRWWAENSRNGTLPCKNPEVTVADFARLDLMHRFGGIYMDLDMIVVSNSILTLGDGMAGQHFAGGANAQALTNSFVKTKKAHPFNKCWFDAWKRHWAAYISDVDECKAAGRDDCEVRPEWGFMGPAALTDAWLSCEKRLTVYPPAAFGHDIPCSDAFFDSNRDSEITLLPSICNQSQLMELVSSSDSRLVGRLAHHTCHQGTVKLDQIMKGHDYFDPHSFMANVVLQRCPDTFARMIRKS